jgi:divalent metal cation (Fe/Co/Zn/Cd) transporter
MCASAVRELLDVQMDADVVQGAEAICRLMPDVTRYSRLRARRVGSVVHVDVEIGLRPHLTISAAHHVCDELRSRIMVALPQVEDVIVHPFPDEGGREATTVGRTESHHRPAVGPAPSPGGHPCAVAVGPAETEAAIRKAALGVKEVTAVTHLRLYYGVGGGERQVRVEMEVLLPLDRPLRECVRACKRVRAAVEALPFVAEADVHLEVEPV